MPNGIYGFASPIGIETGLVRLGGLGLGNLLFSWARSSLFCKAMGADQIYTTWPQIKRRSWTHWEKDRRHYCGLFRPLPGEISGLDKLRLLYSVPQVREEKWNPRTNNSSRQIVVFRGVQNHFQDIPSKEYPWLKERFFSALKDQSLVQTKTEPHIGVHVRLGDHPKYDPNVTSTLNMQLPISWYTNVLERILADSSWRGEIGVCSDATEHELAPLLRMPNVRLVRGRTAQDDLIYLSKSLLMVGSLSTFSQWAAYLSGRPSIWHSGFNRKGGLCNGSFEMIVNQDAQPDREQWNQCMSLAFDQRVSAAADTLVSH
jgi:hypothetical protein